MPPEVEDKTKGTAAPGSDPGTKTDDQTGAKTGVDAAAQKDTPPPFDADPRWKSAREAEKNLQSLMTALDVDSVEALLEVADLGKALREEGVDEDKIKQALAAQKEYDRVKAYWAEQEEKQRLEGETPEDREKRLLEENRELKRKQKDEDERREQKARREKIAHDYDSEVTRLVSADRNIPENERKFVLALCGVQNPTSNINIASKDEIRKAYPEAVKLYMQIRDAVLENAAKGKTAIPRVPGAGAPADEGAPKIKDMKDARKTFREKLMAVFNQ